MKRSALKRTTRIKRASLPPCSCVRPAPSPGKANVCIGCGGRISKMRNRVCTYGDRTFHSRKEADYAARLDLLKKAADPKERIASYKCQVNTDLFVGSDDGAMRNMLIRLQRALDEGDLMGLPGGIDEQAIVEEIGAVLHAKPVKICRIIPDFEVTFADGRTEVHEVKGAETDVWRIKSRLFQALFPYVVYRVIK